MYLTAFQPQILPPHFSMFSKGQKKLMAESLPASGFYVVVLKGKMHHRHVLSLCPEEQLRNDKHRNNRSSSGEKNPRKHEAI